MSATIYLVALLATWVACSLRLAHNVRRPEVVNRWRPDVVTLAAMGGLLALIPPIGWVWLALQFCDDAAGRRLNR